jgi:hypothetical protein
MKRDGDQPEVRYRLGVLVGGDRLLIEVPRWIKERVKAGLDDDEPRAVLQTMYQIMMNLEGIINSFVSMVKARGREMGVYISAYRVSCHLKRCGTCRGLYKTHYPRWSVYANGVQTKIKAREEPTFLRQFVSEEDLKAYYQVMELRQVMLGILNYTQTWFEKMGLVPPPIVEEERHEFRTE